MGHMECSICLEREGMDVILGCDHLFCEECIERWCTRYAATCPTCRLPVHGLSPRPGGIVFLSPHENVGWGMRVVRPPFLSQKGVFLLSSVRPNSISEANGLRERQLVRLFDPSGSPFERVDEAEAFAAESHARKRLLKVQSVDDPCERKGPFQTCLSSLWRRAGLS